MITTAITYNDDLTTGSYLLCACVKATVPKNINELWISTLDEDAMVNNIMVVKSLVTNIAYVVVVIGHIDVHHCPTTKTIQVGTMWCCRQNYNSWFKQLNQFVKRV